MRYATLASDWTRILQQAEIPEPPGYRETLDAIEAEPYRKPVKKKPKRGTKR